MTVALVDILTATYPAPRLLTHRYCGKIIKQLNVGVICYAVIIDNASLFFFFGLFEFWKLPVHTVSISYCAIKKV